MNRHFSASFWGETLVLALVITGGGIAQDQRVSITDFGAQADSQTVNTTAIQKGIDSLASEGGGTLVVPAGTFLSGAIFLKQGVNLHIEKEGVLKGTTQMADYRLIQTRWEGEERIWVSALVNAFDMTGVHLTGTGTIDGSGDVWHQGRRQDGGRPLPARIGPEHCGPPTLGPGGGLPAAPESPAYILAKITLPDYARPRLIAIQNCDNVLVEGLTIDVEEGEPIIRRNAQ